MASLLPEQHSQLRSKAASVAKLTERSRSAGVGKVEIDLLFMYVPPRRTVPLLSHERVCTRAPPLHYHHHHPTPTTAGRPTTAPQH